MAGQEEDFFSGEDFDAILAAIEDNTLVESEEINAELCRVVNEIEEEPSDISFKCEKCCKVCKSKQGLSRHKNSKHRDEGEEEVKEEGIAEDRLHPLHFKKYINNCANQLSSDCCYSDEITTN